MLSRRLLLAAPFATALARPLAAQPSTAADWAALELVDATGQTFRIPDLRPRLKLVKLWANWCPGCLAEMPSLVSLAAQLGPDLEIILVSNADANDWRRDQQTARRLGLPFPLATPSDDTPPERLRGTLRDREGYYVVPRTLLFSGNALAAEYTGSRDWTREALRLAAHT